MPNIGFGKLAIIQFRKMMCDLKMAFALGAARNIPCRISGSSWTSTNDLSQKEERIWNEDDDNLFPFLRIVSMYVTYLWRPPEPWRVCWRVKPLAKVKWHHHYIYSIGRKWQRCRRVAAVRWWQTISHPNLEDVVFVFFLLFCRGVLQLVGL